MQKFIDPQPCQEDRPAGPTLQLPYRRPYNWSAILDFLRDRQIQGVETVAGDRYRRTVEAGNCRGWIDVSHRAADHVLELTVNPALSDRLSQVAQRVRRMFDLDADPDAIGTALSRDAQLQPLVKAHPGLRLPKAWDPFELAVRAVLGQQISVKAAGTIAGRIVRRFGPVLPVPSPGMPDRLFPGAEILAAADLGTVGLTRKRAGYLAHLATVVADGTLRLQTDLALSEFVHMLTQQPGIGPWTAQYIAMRGLGMADAFPDGDLGVVKALSRGKIRPDRNTIRQRAEAWRPFRAYAVMYLWQGGHG